MQKTGALSVSIKWERGEVIYVNKRNVKGVQRGHAVHNKRVGCVRSKYRLVNPKWYCVKHGDIVRPSRFFCVRMATNHLPLRLLNIIRPSFASLVFEPSKFNIVV